MIFRANISWDMFYPQDEAFLTKKQAEPMQQKGKINTVEFLFFSHCNYRHIKKHSFYSFKSPKSLPIKSNRFCAFFFNNTCDP